jgi:hypothetical protein
MKIRTVVHLNLFFIGILTVAASRTNDFYLRTQNGQAATIIGAP